MAKVKIHVWYDASGQIIAVGRPMSPSGSGRHAAPLAGKNQFVLETEVAEDIAKTLHQTHTVDVAKKVLHKSK